MNQYGESEVVQHNGIFKYDKRMVEQDVYKGRAETAEETLKGFDGKDLETITKERSM